MMARVKTIAGTVPCFVCAQTIPAKASPDGGYSACCPWCDASVYGKAGTQAARIIGQKMKRTEPEPEPAPADEPPPAPAPKQAAKKRGLFEL